MVNDRESNRITSSSLTQKILHPNPDILFIAVILPLATVLAFLFLGDKSFWFDEGFSHALTQMGWSEFWYNLTQYEANAGFYYILLKIWSTFGDGEFFLRSLSVIFALISVVMVYVLGSRMYGKRAGLIAALLITVNAFFISYAQETRAYMLAILMGILSSYFLLRAIEKPDRKWWIAYILCSVLGVYSHLYAVFLLIAQFASLVFIPRREIPWKGLLISGATMILLLLPMALFMLTRNIGQIGWVSEPEFSRIYETFDRLTGQNGRFLLLAYFIPCAAASIFMARMYLKEKLSLQLWRHVYILCWLLVPIVVTFLFSYIKPVFVPRFFVVYVPPIVILAAIGINLIKRRWLLLGAISIVVVLASLSLQNWYTGVERQGYNVKDDFRTITSHIVVSAEPGDAIVFFHPAVRVTYDYYLGRFEATENTPTVVHYLSTPEDELNFYHMPEGISSEKNNLPYPERSVLDRLSGHDRVWLILAYNRPGIEHSEMLMGFLQEKYKIVEEQEYYIDIRVYLMTLKES